MGRARGQNSTVERLSAGTRGTATSFARSGPSDELAARGPLSATEVQAIAARLLPLLTEELIASAVSSVRALDEYTAEVEATGLHSEERLKDLEQRASACGMKLTPIEKTVAESSLGSLAIETLDGVSPGPFFGMAFAAYREAKADRQTALDRRDAAEAEGDVERSREARADACVARIKEGCALLVGVGSLICASLGAYGVVSGDPGLLPFQVLYYVTQLLGPAARLMAAKAGTSGTTAVEDGLRGFFMWTMEVADRLKAANSHNSRMRQDPSYRSAYLRECSQRGLKPRPATLIPA